MTLPICLVWFSLICQLSEFEAKSSKIPWLVSGSDKFRKKIQFYHKKYWLLISSVYVNWNMDSLSLSVKSLRCVREWEWEQSLSTMLISHMSKSHRRRKLNQFHLSVSSSYPETVKTRTRTLPVAQFSLHITQSRDYLCSYVNRGKKSNQRPSNIMWFLFLVSTYLNSRVCCIISHWGKHTK